MTSSRAISLVALAEFYSEHAGELWVPLIEVTHADLAATLRLANDSEDITSNGDVYSALQFDVILPVESARRLPRGTVTLDATDGTIVAATRAITTPLDAEFSLVRKSAPDTVVVGPWAFEVLQVSYNASAVTAALAPERLLTSTFPGTAMDPPNLPAMFGPGQGLLA